MIKKDYFSVRQNIERWSSLPELLHHVRVRKVVYDVLQDSFVVGIPQRPEHEHYRNVCPDVRQLRPDLPPGHFAVLVSLAGRIKMSPGAR